MSKILNEFEIEGSIYFCEVMSPPWTLDFTEKRVGSFHCVRRGSCRLTMDGRQHWLGAGDVAIVLNAHAHILEGVSERVSGGLDQETLLVCGYFRFRKDFSHPLFDSLPPLLIVREEDISKNTWLKTNLEYLVYETKTADPGAPHILNRMTEVLIVQLFRHIIKMEGIGSSFVAALYDPKIGRALNLIHTNPEQSWTLQNLAQTLAMSRASFANRFSSLTGMPFFTYLTDLRMRQAAGLLRKSDLAVSQISEQVGYASDASFNRAFRKAVGQSALSYRRATETQ